MDPNMNQADIAATAAVLSTAVHAADDRKSVPSGTTAVPVTGTTADDIQEPFEPGDAGEPPYLMGDTY